MNEHVVLQRPATNDLYEADFHAWSLHQADLVRQRRFDDLDIENIAEEIESLGKNRRQELYRRMARLIEHLIKLDASRLYDPRRQWILSVDEQRRSIAELIAENPSLKPKLAETFARAWGHGAEMAKGGLEEFDQEMISETPSFELSDALDPKFIPEQ